MEGGGQKRGRRGVPGICIATELRSFFNSGLGVADQSVLLEIGAGAFTLRDLYVRMLLRLRQIGQRTRVCLTTPTNNYRVLVERCPLLCAPTRNHGKEDRHRYASVTDREDAGGEPVQLCNVLPQGLSLRQWLVDDMHTGVQASPATQQRNAMFLQMVETPEVGQMV